MNDATSADTSEAQDPRVVFAMRQAHRLSFARSVGLAALALVGFSTLLACEGVEMTGADAGSDAGSADRDAMVRMDDASVGASDAGGPDRGAFDASSDGGASADAGAPGDCASAIVCEDFEAYADMPAGPWTVRALGVASASIDDTVAYAGLRSLHITHTGGRGSATIRTPTNLADPVAHVYGRMMARLGSPWPASHIRVMRMGEINIQDQVKGYHINTVGRTGGPLFMLEGLTDLWGGGGSAPVAPYLDAWTCYEWEFDARSGTLHMWLDGTPMSPPATGLPSVPLEYFSIGYDATGDDPIEMWVDDVVLSTTRVGCP